MAEHGLPYKVGLSVRLRLTWKQRKSDLRKIVEFQNNGDITRIYTIAMAEQFEADLRQLKAEYKL